MVASVKHLQTQAIADTSLGDWAAAAIAKHYRKFHKRQAAVLADRDPEDLHQMRIGLRRLRSALRGFAPAIALPKAASNRRAGKLARTLGTLRDLDVLSASFSDRYLPELPPTEQKAVRPAARALQRQRRHAFKTVKRALTGKPYAQLTAGLKTWLAEPRYQPLAQVPLAPVLPDLLLPDLSDLLLQPAWWIGTVPVGDRHHPAARPEAAAIDRLRHDDSQSLHNLRKTAKRVRYQMELFAPCYGEPYQRAIAQVKAIQTVLGDVQDSVVLSKFLAQTLGTDWSQRLPAFATHLQADRNQKWQEWQALQRQFRDPDARHALRATVLPQPPAATPETVADTATAIATDAS